MAKPLGLLFLILIFSQNLWGNSLSCTNLFSKDSQVLIFSSGKPSFKRLDRNFQQKRYAEAYRLGQEILAIEPGNLKAGKITFKAALALNRYNEALDILISLEKNIAKPEELYASFIKVYGRLKRYDDQLAIIQKAKTTFRGVYKLMSTEVKALLKLGRIDEAKAIIARMKEINSEDSFIFMLEAQVFLVEGRFEEALMKVDNFLSFPWNAKDVVALGLKMRIHGEKGDLAEAIETQLLILALKPRDFLALALGGLYKLELGRYQQAENDLSRALKIEPRNMWVQWNRAQALFAQGQVRTLEAMAKAMPEGIMPRYFLEAQVAVLRRQFDLAIAKIELLAPNYRSQKLLAQIYYHKGRMDWAYAVLKNLVEELRTPNYFVAAALVRIEINESGKVVSPLVEAILSTLEPARVQAFASQSDAAFWAFKPQPASRKEVSVRNNFWYAPQNHLRGADKESKMNMGHN